jgi:hypothetical protein
MNGESNPMTKVCRSIRLFSSRYTGQKSTNDIQAEGCVMDDVKNNHDGQHLMTQLDDGKHDGM